MASIIPIAIKGKRNQREEAREKRCQMVPRNLITVFFVAFCRGRINNKTGETNKKGLLLASEHVRKAGKVAERIVRSC